MWKLSRGRGTRGEEEMGENPSLYVARLRNRGLVKSREGTDLVRVEGRVRRESVSEVSLISLRRTRGADVWGKVSR